MKLTEAIIHNESITIEVTHPGGVVWLFDVYYPRNRRSRTDLKPKNLRYVKVHTTSFRGRNPRVKKIYLGALFTDGKQFFKMCEESDHKDAAMTFRAFWTRALSLELGWSWKYVTPAIFELKTGEEAPVAPDSVEASLDELVKVVEAKTAPGETIPERQFPVEDTRPENIADLDYDAGLDALGSF